ncbi:MAG: three-Cys-motif partner protein TcmP [Myxococcota bacterium]
MGNADKEHFDSYRDQTRIKHTILERYLRAYFTIMNKRADRLVYIDGFAGRGSYASQTGPVDGSPLRALGAIASIERLRGKVETLFIERDRRYLKSLQEAVELFCIEEPDLLRPELGEGRFARVLTDKLDAAERAGSRLPPTFLFVDPCGVQGTSFEVISRVLERPLCEAFIFFNLDGISRIIGQDNSDSETLAEVLGSEARVKDFLDALRPLRNPQAREDHIIHTYRNLLSNETPATYIAPFRVEFEERRRTSHYLIHATKHKLGFKIMKDIMWQNGRRQDGPGGLEYQQASMEKQFSMFDYQQATVVKTITRELETCTRCRVEHFTDQLAGRAEDLVAPRGYRDALQHMERQGTIIVEAKDGSGERAKRQPGTLGDEYFVTLSRNHAPPQTSMFRP